MIKIIYVIMCFINFYVFVSLIKKFIESNKKIISLIDKINMCYVSKVSKNNIITISIILLCHFTFFALTFDIIFIKINMKNTIIQIIIILFVYLVFYYIYGYGLLVVKNSKEYLILILLLNIYTFLVFACGERINILRGSGNVFKIIMFCGYGIMYIIILKQVIYSAFIKTRAKVFSFIEYIYYLIEIVYTLFLGSCIIEIFYEGSYMGIVSYFDLLYNTIITFATIGFGDVEPCVFQSKAMSIIIAITSIITISSSLNRILDNKSNS